MNVLVTGARAPIAADLARALALNGHCVWVADSLRAPLGAASPFVRGYVRLPAPRADFRGFCARLAAVCTQLAIGAVIPTSEEVFWLAGAALHLPATTQLRTSPLPVLARLHHKGTFAQLAVRLGYGAPANHDLTAPQDFARLGDPAGWVVKPAHSRFATRTLIAPTARALARLRPTPAAPWVAQTRVTGSELCAYNLAESGRLLLHVAYEPRFRLGVGASVYFSPVRHAGLRAMSERFIAATNFTGQISFDAIETERGLVALECNPRGTSGAHLAVQQPAAFAAALLGERFAAAPAFTPEPRMLLLPLLLSHPGSLLRAGRRARLHAARDALAASGVSRFSQILALAEMAWCAARRRTGLSTAATADFEWNGEPMHG